MGTRHFILEQWLQNMGYDHSALELLPGDASFRRYFRLHHAGVSYIVMDAPPERENCRPFVAIAHALLTCGLQVPRILASDVGQGFLLLTDLGHHLYLKELTLDNAKVLYQRALDALFVLQNCRYVSDWEIPPFTAAFMRQELDLCQEWFLTRHLNLPLTLTKQALLNSFFNDLTQSAANQPYVFMHRDYHSANLMMLPSEQVGILDFQDAFMGPITYDLVSLLRDCYVVWPEALVAELALYYKAKFHHDVSDAEFLRWFDWMGMQRHLKALLTFARKYHRDGNAHYLQHIPRTVNYLLAVSQRYPESQAFYQFCMHDIMPALSRMEISCVQ